jgi:hypothetical protein
VKIESRSNLDHAQPKKNLSKACDHKWKRSAAHAISRLYSKSILDRKPNGALSRPKIAISTCWRFSCPCSHRPVGLRARQKAAGLGLAITTCVGSMTNGWMYSTVKGVLLSCDDRNSFWVEKLVQEIRPVPAVHLIQAIQAASVLEFHRPPKIR